MPPSHLTIKTRVGLNELLTACISNKGIGSFLDRIIPEKMSSMFVLDPDDPEIGIKSTLPCKIG